MAKLRIYLHGHLRDKVKKDYVDVEANNIFDGLKNLVSRYKKELKAPMDLGRWKVKIKDFDTKESWYVPLFVDSIHLYPVFKTAKSQWATIAVGAALALTGWGLAAWAAAAPTSLVAAAGITANWAAVAGTVATGLTYAGTALMIQGVMNLLFPAPKMDTSAEAKTNSKYLGAPNTTTSAGTRIPFGYGKYKISGHYISYNISSTLLAGK